MENINSIKKIPEGSVFINNSIYCPINISNNSLIPSNTFVYKGKMYIKFENKEDKVNNEKPVSIIDNNEIKDKILLIITKKKFRKKT